MKKFLFIVLLLIIVGAAILYFRFSSIAGSAIKGGVETFGPRLTQTPVTLGNAHVSASTGTGGLSNLTVGNPEGYTTPHAIFLGEIELGVEPKSLLEDTVHVRNIHIRQPEFIYERKLTTSNLEEILKNIQAVTGSEASEDDAGDGKRFMIDEVIIEDAKVTATALGQQANVTMPRLELRDIGKTQGGVTAAEASREILGQVLKQVVNVAVEAVADGQLGGVEVDDRVKRAAGALQGIMGGGEKKE